MEEKTISATQIKHDLEILIRGFENNNYMFDIEDKNERMEAIFSHKTWINAQVCFARIIGAITTEEEENYSREVMEIARKKNKV